MFKLDDLDTSTQSEQGFVVEIEGPNGIVGRNSDGKPNYTITVRGQDSQAYRAASRALTNRRLQKGNRAKLTAEELESESLELLAAATMDWNGFVDASGNPVPCTKQSAITLYRDYPIVREQVDKAINDRANFSRASLTA